MIVFICLNCKAVDPPYDTNHRCLVCCSGSVIVNETMPEMNLNTYLFLYKDLIKAQSEMIKSSGKFLGYDDVMRESTIEEYIENSSRFLHENLTSNETLDEIKLKIEELCS